MSRFRKRPVVVDAVRWFGLGDHPAVGPYNGGLKSCMRCGSPMRAHGWVWSVDDGPIVCPGDWVIRHENGGPYRHCQPAIFEQTYEEVA